MPTYRITAPDGRQFDVTAPDGATQDQVLAYAQSQWKPGASTAAAIPEIDTDPTKGGGTLEVYNPFGRNLDTGIPLSQGVNRFLGGAGKAFSDLGAGAKQLSPMLAGPFMPASIAAQALLGSDDTESWQQVAETKRLDKPLMNTGAGLAGNLTGNVAALIPTAFVPGANTIPGAAAIGAASGLLAPQAEGNVAAGKIEEAAVGGLLGAGGVAAGRLAGAGWNATKGLLEPFRKVGQENIVGRTLQRFATDPDAAAAAAAGVADRVPGYASTLAEVTQDPGIATLQRAVMSTDAAAQLGARDMSNLQAVKTAIQGIAGDDAAMAAAQGARTTATRPLYAAADSASASADDALRGLLERPSMKKAWSRASDLAKESGITLKEGVDVPASKAASPILDRLGRPVTTDTPAQSATYSGRALQYLKMGIDDMLANPGASGIGAHEERALKNTRSALIQWADEAIPELGTANAAYAELSKPINQMQVGRALYERVAPALDDYAAQPGARAASFTQALRNSDQTVKTATGLNKSIDQVLSPKQMGAVNDAATALAKRAAAQNMARGVGSNTAQNLASQNLVRQIAGPLGLPQSFTESRVLPTLLRPLNFALSAQEPAINGLLAEALLDPKMAAQLLRRAQEPSVAGLLADQAGRYVLQPGLLGANATQQ